VQAEYGWNFVDDAFGVFAPATGTLTRFATPQNYVFSGGYLQFAYTLTGEHRNYDRRFGTLGRAYLADGPYENAYLVRDENGHCCWGMGAWEIAARLSYVDLNDGSGTNRIQGGRLEGLTLGLNWYLNSNLNFMFDWAYDHRDDLPAGVAAGFTSGFGMRMQCQF
jgi:phosphate-selective porin OprO/OprP